MIQLRICPFDLGEHPVAMSVPTVEYRLHLHILDQYIEDRTCLIPYQRRPGQAPTVIQNQLAGVNVRNIHVLILYLYDMAIN
jgi:hypothetical protein